MKTKGSGGCRRVQVNLTDAIINCNNKVLEHIPTQQTSRFSGASLNFRAGAGCSLEQCSFLVSTGNAYKGVRAFKLAEFHRGQSKLLNSAAGIYATRAPIDGVAFSQPALPSCEGALNPQS